MLHSMRCNPPNAQTIALDMFDGMVCRSFGDFTGLHLNASQWDQASLGLAHGGLGLRSTSKHSAAAFLASWASSLHTASDLDASFSVEEAKANPDVAAALATFNSQLAPTEPLTLEVAMASKQHALSHLLDEAGWNARPCDSFVRSVGWGSGLPRRSAQWPHPHGTSQLRV